jgi:hypothetical protein
MNALFIKRNLSESDGIRAGYRCLFCNAEIYRCSDILIYYHCCYASVFTLHDIIVAPRFDTLVSAGMLITPMAVIMNMS